MLEINLLRLLSSHVDMLAIAFIKPNPLNQKGLIGDEFWKKTLTRKEINIGS